MHPTAVPDETWYRPGASVAEFHQDPSFVRVLIGGRGSGKTFGLCMEAIRHGWNNAGAKIIFARKNENSQAGSTIDTLTRCFHKLGDLYSQASHGLWRSWNNGYRIRIPSRLAVERYNQARTLLHGDAEVARWVEGIGSRWCSEIEMKGLPHVVAGESKLRGMECSMMAFIEGDQIEQRQFALSFACLRWVGTDPEVCDENGFIRDRGIVMDTNPPSPKHWIAEIEAAELAKPAEERRMRFWHICTDENEHNLPANYIEETIMLPYANNPPMIRRMRYGEYADAFDGKPVFYAYRPERHDGEDLPWPTGAYLVRGWDFGTNNSVVWSAYWIHDGTEYWRDLLEQYLEGSDTDRQARQAIETTQNEFPFWNDRTICAGVLDFCDPAGNNSSFTKRIQVNGKQVNESAVNILRTNGINPGWQTKARGLPETIAIVNRLLEKRDSQGRYVYRVDRKGCPLLVRGLAGGYRYPAVGEPGYGKDEPLKGPLCDNLDHIQDGARYAKINALRLLKAEIEQAKRPNYASAYKNPNPARKM